MELSELQHTLIGYGNKEITFLLNDNEYSIGYIDATKIEGKITFGLKKNKLKNP